MRRATEHDPVRARESVPPRVCNFTILVDADQIDTCADRLRPFINGSCLAPGVPVVRMSNYCYNCQCNWTLSSRRYFSGVWGDTQPARIWTPPVCVGRQCDWLTRFALKTPRNQTLNWVTAPSMN
ncbi:MAG: hypothetical protein QOE52_5697 [Mycobacterium sp.]|nr:hypothetical protein [Mycobacterium sp.]